MLIATWNVNSIRARLGLAVPWIRDAAPDVLCLQETKVVDEDFPRGPFEELGYRVEVFGQKTYNGVAILSRLPLEDVTRGLPGDGPEDPRRVIEATVDGIRILNLYVPNGKAAGTEAYEAKLAWLRRLREHLDRDCDPAGDLVMLGDMNIAPEDRDVYDPEALRETIHVSTPEREALAHVLEFGLVDAFRLHHPEAGLYSWWDYRAGMFRRGLGLRIDLVYVTKPLAPRVTRAEIDRAARAGEKPSDHAPVLVRID